MKNFIVLAGLLVFCVSGSAQEGTGIAFNAQFVKKNCVSINPDIDLQPYYLINASIMEFTDETAAKKWCGHHSNNLITYSVADFENNIIRLTIHSDRTDESHNSKWWNDYLNSLWK